MASLIMCFMTELSPDEATKTLEQVRWHCVVRRSAQRRCGAQDLRALQQWIGCLCRSICPDHIR